MNDSHIKNLLELAEEIKQLQEKLSVKKDDWRALTLYLAMHQLEYGPLQKVTNWQGRDIVKKLINAGQVFLTDDGHICKPGYYSNTLLTKADLSN